MIKPARAPLNSRFAALGAYLLKRYIIQLGGGGYGGASPIYYILHEHSVPFCPIKCKCPGGYKLNQIEEVLGLMPPFITCYMNRLTCTMLPGKVQLSHANISLVKNVENI